jgi:hypothetical protein
LLSGGRAETVSYHDRGAAVAVLGHDDLLHEQLHKLAPLAPALLGVGLHSKRELEGWKSSGFSSAPTTSRSRIQT